MNDIGDLFHGVLTPAGAERLRTRPGPCIVTIDEEQQQTTNIWVAGRRVRGDLEIGTRGVVLSPYESSVLPEPSTQEAAAEYIDQAARYLANSRNDCEGAWFLRGCWESLTGDDDLAPAKSDLYRRQYNAGVLSGRVLNTIAESEKESM